MFQHLVPDGYAPTQDILAGQAGLEPAAHGLTVEKFSLLLTSLGQNAFSFHSVALPTELLANKKMSIMPFATNMNCYLCAIFFLHHVYRHLPLCSLYF